MQIGKVIGNAHATVKHSSLHGWKLLLVQFTQCDGCSPDGDPLLAVDATGAGIGDRVMLSGDGKQAREMMECDTTPVRWVVLGIEDQ